MTTNVLLVGCSYSGPPIEDANIEVLGLCRPDIDRGRAAYVLYEYDVIVINPESYSHFMFGRATTHSASDRELWDLKQENNSLDLDTAFDQYDRAKELSAAIAQGTRVVWLLQRQKHINFFGRRSIFVGYVSEAAQRLVESGTLHDKKSRRLTTTADVGEFKPFFDHIQSTGWSLCLADHNESLEPFAATPEGYALGGRVKVGASYGWLLTPPQDQEGMNLLIRGALGLPLASVPQVAYHGIFLSHTSTDKPFVRDLKARLESHGVKEVWLDEAEIMLGDSLIKKIEEGLKKTKYIGVVLSLQSIKSPWVERELEVAINREISTGEVVVLPLLYEKCELPSFLVGKMYADFTSPAQFDEGVEKLLRRLKAK
jgi:hypothetical protein